MFSRVEKEFLSSGNKEEILCICSTKFRRLCRMWANDWALKYLLIKKGKERKRPDLMFARQTSKICEKTLE